MNRKERYQGLLEQIRLAHRAFASRWAEVKADELLGVHVQPGLKRIWQANDVAYRTTDPLAHVRNQLLERLFSELPPPEAFLHDNYDAVDALIDFLQVDVTAFRCGYAKENVLRVLRKLILTKHQRKRLREYTLVLCAMPQHRREITHAGRLMIQLADACFIDELQKLTLSDNPRVRKKSAKLLDVVLNGQHAKVKATESTSV